MFPTLRSLSRANLAWHRIAENTAPGAVPTCHTRVVLGQVKTITRRPKKMVSNGAKVTGTLLLKLAYRGAQRLVGAPSLWSQVVMSDAGVPELPPVYTNGRQLGEQRGVTDRTIRTHVAELKRAGLITRYKYRGTNASYCLWVSPDYVWETPLKTPEAGKMPAPENAFSEPKRINLPLTEILESTGSSKSEISEEDKLVTARGSAAEDWNPLSGSAGAQANSPEPPRQVSKSGADGAGAARRARFYREQQARGSDAKKAEAKKLVESFWLYAKALIYKGQVFNVEAERLSKNAIWYGVFGGFAEGEPADWLAWLPGLQRRVELAAAWLARNPGKFPPLPFAEVVGGRGYFDAENERGFAGTRRWWQAEQQKNHQGALERAVDEAIAELKQRRALDAGTRRVQASKRARQKTQLELHRFHHTKLRRLGGEEALVRLAARLQAEHLLSL